MILTTSAVLIVFAALIAREGGKASRETARREAWIRLEVDRYNR